MKEVDRNQLRRLVDEARRSEIDNARRLREELRKRSSTEVKRDTAERKAIFAAQLAHDTDLEELALVASAGPDVYLVSVGVGSARVLDLRGDSPWLSQPENIYALLATEVDWLPFTGDSEPIVAVAAQLIEASHLA